MGAMRRFWAGVMALLLVFVSVLPSGAVSTANPTLLAHFGGRLSAVAVSGSTLYVGSGPLLSIFDISNPATPVAQGKILLPGSVNDLAVSGTTVFLAIEKMGLWVVDATDAASPSIVGFHSLSSGASKVVVQGAMAYVVSGYLLVQLNVADPANIQTSLTYDAGAAFVISLGGFVGSYIVVGMSDGVRTIDTATMTPASAIASGAVLSVLVNGNTLYVYINNDGMRVIDASNPASLVKGARFADPAPNGLVQTATHLFVSSFTNITIYSLTNPATPTLVKTYFPIGGSTRSFGTNGNHLYLGNNASGFDIIDAANIDNLQRLGSQALPGYAHDSAAVGNTIYALNGGALYLLNSTARSAPTVLSRFQTPNTTFTSLAVDGNRVYLVREFQGVSVVSVVDPANPALLGSVDFSGPASDIAVDGSHVFVASGPSGLRVIDVSNPASPQQVGSLASTGFSSQLAIVGDFVYIADSSAGLRVVDVSDPASPQEKGLYKPTGSVTAVAAVDNTRILIGVDGVGLELIDISNSAAPTRLAGLMALSQTVSIVAGNGKAFAVGSVPGPSGLQSQMVSLMVGDSILTPTDSLALNDTGQIALSTFYLLLALGNGGLGIYRNPDAPVLDKFVFLPQIAK